MLRLGSSRPLVCALAMVGAWFVIDARDARACGGCFHPPPGPTEVTSLVTDHRMAFSISPAQTVLWDQIRYTGNPSDFAWVLPVKPGARVELSHDAWIASLDASTQTVIQGPAPACGGGVPTDYTNSGGGGGCGFGGASAASDGFAGGGSADAGSYGYDAASPVTVVSQEVVGPYDAVTVRSSQGEALGDWLRANGYDVAASIQPTIDAFTAEGFDFLALKLAPGQGVQAMQPVRVVTPGADASLPLRMVAAGVGARVGIELFVLSEGRYGVQNFPDVAIDFTQLAWDPYASRSNYSSLAQAAMTSAGGTGWLTESAQPVNLFAQGGLNPPLSQTYASTCAPQTILPPAGCGAAGPEAGADSPSGDAASDGAGDTALDGASDAAKDTGADAGGDAGACNPVVVPCDDLTLAMTGIATGNLWVTRLRADLPSSALAADLVLEASSSQGVLPNVHTTETYTDPKYNPCATSSSTTPASSPSPSSGCACRTAEESPRTRYADVLVLTMGAVGIALSVRRRRRR